MADIDITTRDAEVLRVKPGEVLILKLNEEWINSLARDEDDGAQVLNELHSVLEQGGLKGRFVILVGDVEFAVVEPE